MGEVLVGGKPGQIVEVPAPPDVAPIPPPNTIVLFVEAPRETTLKLTRRKTNTSTQILLTVNKSQKVFWDGAEV